MIVVPGRFHAFDLARALQEQGVHVHLVTNYPAWAVRKFDLRPDRLSSHLLHGLLVRMIARLGTRAEVATQPFLMRFFGRFARRKAQRSAVDFLYIFSGVAEEAFSDTSIDTVKVLARGSAHIEEQFRLLHQEEERCGVAVEKPTQWIIERERREYALADQIVTLSRFAEDSFRERGQKNVARMPQGVQVERFLATKDQLQRRADRYAGSEPLKVLFAGAFSMRKGAMDLLEVSRRLRGDFTFTVVGNINEDARCLAEDAREFIRFIPRVAHHELPSVYARHDLFLFPTIEDGFAAVLAQAFAAGLPIVATTNCGAREVIGDGDLGWIVPIRSPDQIMDRLRWIHRNRKEVGKKIEDAGQLPYARTWRDAANDLLGIVAARRLGNASDVGVS